VSGAVVVRRAGVDDAEELLALEHAVKGMPRWSATVWAETLASSRRGVWVAEIDRDVVGLCVGSVVSGVAEVESIAVRATEQRQGVGRALLAALVSWAAAQGAEVLELEVRASNVAALRFYQAVGFGEQGRRVAYYSYPVEDAVLMQLRLGRKSSALRQI
jgi:ribosomal-protein-alanine N-acetyltransferase